MPNPDKPDMKNVLYEEIFHAVEHFSHVLPAQASIRDFVHHNTLHGFEHLKFKQAMKASHELTGAYGYWPQEKFRQCYLKGRVTDKDIHAALAKDDSLESSQLIFKSDSTRTMVLQQDVYRIAALFPLKKISSCQLKWQAEEAHAFDQFQDDIPAKSKSSLLASSGKEEEKAIQDLWASCINVLELDAVLLHPEELVDLAPERAEKIFSKLTTHEDFITENDESLSESEKEQQRSQQEAWKKLEALTYSNTIPNNISSKRKSKSFNLRALIKTLTGFEVNKEIIAPSQSKIDPVIQKKSWKLLEHLVSKIGDEVTLRGFLKKLTGEDVQEEITPYLLPYIASWLDEGFAQWHNYMGDADSKKELGFYQSWKASAVVDESGVFNDIPDWKEHINSLPDTALDTVVAELRRMSIPKKKWGDYLTRLALDLPGWSGMFYWRHENPEYPISTEMHVEIMDYLAIRLVLEHLYIRKLCRKLWLIEGDLETIRGYLHQQHAELLVRYTLYNEHLPEYIKGGAQHLMSLTAQRDSLSMHAEEWQELAQMVWTWQQSPSSDSSLPAEIANNRNSSLHHDGWVLFRLAQHLGLSDVDIGQMTKVQLDTIFECIHRIDEETAGFVLLEAYECHYRNEIFTAISKNHGRGTWPSRDVRPEAQLVFCMDDREEGFRRHLEHLNPAIETLGAAAFFGVVMKWKDLDKKDSVVLCPVIVTPEHEIEEVAAENHIEEVTKHKQRYALRTRIRDFIHQDSHRSLLQTSLLTALYAPLTLVTLMGKNLSPLKWSQSILALQKTFDKEKITRTDTTFSKDKKPTSSHLKHGFTIDEQTNIVEGFLQNNGLLSGFSPFVVLIGHYSRNQNNPHAAAYGCGACGGKYSGPNGRVFASMANNLKVRLELEKRNIIIPDDCWFIGAEHDTCNEHIKWEDTDLIPENLLDKFKQLQKEVNIACQYSAHERCRKLASAPKKPTLLSAIKHIAGRAVDFSQARPELGHATIASGFVGRRHLSQGTFMDRRCFLISYDSNIDPEGTFLERILLSAGPVGAGINLEYYFSSVNNKKYGCGSKVVHNVAGLFGVMEGGCGDLRTGLPLQMIEIHEPMRLQLMVEAKTEVLTKIYTRQPSIQQLVGNGWILLSAKDPDSAEIHTFDPEKGWELWESPDDSSDNIIPLIKNSQEWYKDHYDHLSPALIETVKRNNQPNKFSKEVSNA